MQLFTCTVICLQGQLGDGTVTAIQRPRMVTALHGKRIIKVSCGSAHTIALSTSEASDNSRPPPITPLEYDFIRDLPPYSLLGNIPSTSKIISTESDNLPVYFSFAHRSPRISASLLGAHLPLLAADTNQRRNLTRRTQRQPRLQHQRGIFPENHPNDNGAR